MRFSRPESSLSSWKSGGQTTPAATFAMRQAVTAADPLPWSGCRPGRAFGPRSSLAPTFRLSRNWGFPVTRYQACCCSCRWRRRRAASPTPTREGGNLEPRTTRTGRTWRHGFAGKKQEVPPRRSRKGTPLHRYYEPSRDRFALDRFRRRVYIGGTWTEGTVTQGCDRSADPGPDL